MLDIAQYPNTDTLFATLTTLATPVLILSSPEQAPSLIARLNPHHDICLMPASAAMITHRMKGLLHKQEQERDTLTGLLTRRSFLLHLTQARKRASPEQPLSIVLVDIDHFKTINDERGHQAGDRILQELAQRLTSTLGPGITLARHSGEQYIALLDATLLQTQQHAEQILSAVRTHTFHLQEKVRVSLSAVTLTSAEDNQAIMQKLEQAMYAAKARGRDTFVHHTTLTQEAQAQQKDLEVHSFEDMTHVLSERMAKHIARRGRRILTQFRQEADIDGLTGLYSRRYMDRRLTWAFAQDQTLTIAMLDIDFFGKVNKTHGWLCGDRVLRDIATLVKTNLRQKDWSARYGGEEFCIVMDDTTLNDAHTVLERLRETVAQHTFLNEQGQPFQMTVSLGAEIQQDTHETLEALLHQVSDKLLQAKRAGRNRVHI